MARIDTLPNFLTDVANSIREKTGKSEELKPEAYDVEIKSISSGATKSNIYRVPTIAERDAITDMVEGDICVVLHSKLKTTSVGDTLSTIVFPQTVVLDTPVTDDTFIMPNISLGDSKMLRGEFEKTVFRLEYQDMANEKYDSVVRYTSEDGATYTRTSSKPRYDLPVTKVVTENTYEDARIGQFICIEDTSFEGMFTYTNGAWISTNINIFTDATSVYKGEKAYTSKGIIEGTLGTDNSLNTMKKINTLLKRYTIPGPSVKFENKDVINGTIPVIQFIDASNITDFDFISCTDLEYIDLSNFIWNTTNTIRMEYTFAECTKLKEVKFGNVDTSKVEDFSSLFLNCTSLEKLDLSSFDTSNATIIYGLFKNCTSLKHLDIRKFDFGKCNNYAYLFSSVPNDCLIIVKDATQKSWINSKFNNLANVKTVEEYEISQQQSELTDQDMAILDDIIDDNTN